MFACRHVDQVLENRLGAFAFVQPVLRAELDRDIEETIDFGLLGQSHIAAREMPPFGRQLGVRLMGRPGTQLGRDLAV